MGIVNRRITNFVKLISSLANKPRQSQGMTGDDVKAWMDSSPEELRVSLNGIIDDLTNETEGTSGAEQLGCPPIALEDNSAANPFAKMRWMYQQMLNVILNQIPAGTITVDKLAFDPVTESELATFLETYSSGGAGILIKNSDITGVRKADALTEDNSCVYAVVPASASTELMSVVTSDIRMGLHSIILRMMSANNAIAADVIKVEIFRNNSGTFASVSSKLFKPTVFNVTTDYENLYVPFEYKGGKATNNEIKIVVSLLANATVFEVDLDNITILPSTLGIVG